MSANHPRKRRKESGFCSRVSIMATGKGVRSCVPPRSASTGSGGCGTGLVSVVHCSGDGMSLRLRGMVAELAELYSLEGSQRAEARIKFCPLDAVLKDRSFTDRFRIFFRTGQRRFQASIARGRVRLRREISRTRESASLLLQHPMRRLPPDEMNLSSLPINFVPAGNCARGF